MTIIRIFTPKLGLLHLPTFVVRKYLIFLGEEIGGLFSNYGFASVK